MYPSQTKILEGLTKENIWIFEALFNGVSTRYGLRAIEKSVENPDFNFCSSFQHLRLGSIKCIYEIAKHYFLSFKGVSTRFGLRTIEKYIENLDFLFCSIFQNLRLGA
jgi:hypothetical protein